MTEKAGTQARSPHPTVSDVAALAGVSRAAVSQVFNNKGSISEVTKQRIRQAAGTLNWTPSPTAVALRRSRFQTVGLVLNRASEVGATGAALITGLESLLSPRDYGLLLYLVDRHSGQEAEFYRGLASARRVDGFILTDSLVGDTRFELMRSLGLTAVLIGTPWIDDPVPHVDTDDPGAGIAESVEHLVALGHRRLAYVGGPADRVPAVRRRGAFEKTLAAAGLTSVATITTNYSTESAAQRTRELLDLACPPTAVLYGTDEMAIAGLRTAKMCGVRVPEDLSVIGFDGLPLGEWMDPQLTTVRRDVVERGRAAAAVLLRLLGETVEGDYPLTYPQLVLRGSTAPPPQDD